MSNTQKAFFFFSLVCLFGLELSFAQNVTHSPYSFYGIGEPHQRVFSQHRTMGGAGFAHAASGMLHPQNPALYSLVDYPTFQADFFAENWKINSGSSSITPRNSYLNGGAFSVPLGKRFGMALSLMPYTRMGYQITSKGSTVGVGNYSAHYEGIGGINLFSGGLGATLIKNDKQLLTLGASFLYYFGFNTVVREVNQFESDATMTNATAITKVNMRDPGVESAFRYSYKFDKNLKVAVAVGYAPGLKIHAKSLNQVYTYKTTSAAKLLKDTVVYSEKSGNAVIPSALQMGLSLEFSQRLWVNVDYYQKSWSKLEVMGVNKGLKDAQSLHVGIQVHPDPGALKSYLKLMQYRAGVRYSISPVDIGGQIAESAFSAGLGLPLMPSKTKTMFQIGIEFGNRGTAGNGQVQETLTTLFFGATFTPFKTDQWFVRRKYD